MKNAPLWRRALYASRGLRSALRNEASFRAEIMAVVLGLLFLAWLQPPLIWWALVLVLMALILAVELLNSAVEALADLLEPDFHPLIARAKDSGAAAVLVLSLTSVAVAAMLLWRHLQGGG